ncbi:hypothetical protein AB2B38_003655 [Balneola sp. MJW-20]|uniref:hypothetical protein n=1 Tax=Gracilimonas aurantiaca TaxID=3234185 RepID=UPI003466BDC2
MFINRSHILILFLTFILIGCVTGPDYERDNPNDPESDNFIPPTPKWVDNISGQYLFDSENKSITFKWLDGDYEEGYIIEKKLGEEGAFTELARLQENDTSFVDNSGYFADPTYYRVSTYIRSEIRDSVDYTSEPLEFKIEFNSLHGIDYFFFEDNSQIEARIIRRNNDNLITFESGFILDYKQNSDQEDWETLDTLFWGEYNLERIIQDIPLNVFHLQYRLTRFLRTGERDIQLLESRDMDEFIRDIRNPEFEMVDELTTNVFWQHDHQPEGVIVYFRTNYEDYELAARDTVYSGIEDRFLTYDGIFSGGFLEIGVQPFSGSNFGRVAWLGYSKGISNPAPLNPAIRDEGNGGLTLSWDIGWPQIPVSGYIISRSTLNETLSPYDTVAAGVNTYTDEQVLPTQSYKYSVRSYLSTNSDSLQIRYQNALVNEVVLNRDKYYASIAESEFGRFYAAYDQNNQLLDVYDENGNMVRSLNLPVPANLPDQTPAVRNIKFNRDQSYLAYLTIAQNIEPWNNIRLTVVDINTGSYFTYDNPDFNTATDIFFPQDNDTLIIVESGQLIKFDLETESASGTVPGYNSSVMLQGLLDSENLIISSSVGGATEFYLHNTVSNNKTIIEQAEASLKEIDYTNGVIFYTTDAGLYSYDVMSNSKSFITAEIRTENSQILSRIRNSSLWYYSSFGFGNTIYDEETDRTFSLNLSIPDDSNFSHLIARQPYYDLSSGRYRMVTVTGLHSYSYTQGWVTY